MCNEKSTSIGLLVLCTSFYFGTVEGGTFRIDDAKKQVEGILKYMFGLLGMPNEDLSSINRAQDLAALTTIANGFITTEYEDQLKEKARQGEADNMSNEFIGYQNLFDGLLKEDKNTEGKDIPLAEQIARIATAWVGPQQAD